MFAHVVVKADGVIHIPKKMQSIVPQNVNMVLYSTNMKNSYCITSEDKYSRYITARNQQEFDPYFKANKSHKIHKTARYIRYNKKGAVKADPNFLCDIPCEEGDVLNMYGSSLGNIRFSRRKKR